MLFQMSSLDAQAAVIPDLPEESGTHVARIDENRSFTVIPSNIEEAEQQVRQATEEQAQAQQELSDAEAADRQAADDLAAAEASYDADEALTEAEVAEAEAQYAYDEEIEKAGKPLDEIESEIRDKQITADHNEAAVEEAAENESTAEEVAEIYDELQRCAQEDYDAAQQAESEATEASQKADQELPRRP